MKPRSITLTVNGYERTAEAEPRVTLLDFLRGNLIHFRKFELLLRYL